MKRYRGFHNKAAYKAARHLEKLEKKATKREARHERAVEREGAAARKTYEAGNPLVVYLISTPQYNEALQQHLQSVDDYDLQANPVNFLNASDMWGAMDIVEAHGSIDVLILQACNSTVDPDWSFGEIANHADRHASSLYIAKGRPDYELPGGITIGHMNDYGVLREYLVEQRNHKTDLGT